jgi:hypothetical protein
MKSGQAKNFRLTLDGDGLEKITCGYYGTKGAGKMYELDIVFTVAESMLTGMLDLGCKL